MVGLRLYGCFISLNRSVSLCGRHITLAVDLFVSFFLSSIVSVDATSLWSPISHLSSPESESNLVSLYGCIRKKTTCPQCLTLFMKSASCCGLHPVTSVRVGRVSELILGPPALPVGFKPSRFRRFGQTDVFVPLTAPSSETQAF